MIKPIQTKYHGCLFRSRLEARWAVFLDSLGIEWEYEKEGYDLDGVWYLPDFWIPYRYGPGWGFWLEIKPVPLSKEELSKCAALAAATGHRTFAICGQPWITGHRVYVFQHHHGGEPASVPLIGDGRLTVYEGGYCCRIIVESNAAECFPSFTNGDKDCSPADLMKAFSAARQARFEQKK